MAHEHICQVFDITNSAGMKTMMDTLDSWSSKGFEVLSIIPRATMKANAFTLSKPMMEGFYSEVMAFARKPL